MDTLTSRLRSCHISHSHKMSTLKIVSKGRLTGLAQNAHKVGISLRAAGNWANWPAVRLILPTWIDHLEDFFSYKYMQV